MHTFKQHFREKLSEMTRPGMERYFRTSVRDGNKKFKRQQYERDTNDLLRQADDLVSRMEQSDKDKIKGEVAAMLMKIRKQYEASSDEVTDSKGHLARKRTDLVRRSNRMSSMPSYSEAVEFLRDIKAILRG